MDKYLYTPSKVVLPQFCSRVLVVSPTRFKFNEETAKDNAFQQSPSKSAEKQTEEVRWTHTLSRLRRSMLNISLT